MILRERFIIGLVLTICVTVVMGVATLAGERALAQEIDSRRAADLFAEANALFREALEARGSDAGHEAVNAKLTQSIDRWEQIIDGGVHNGRLYYNIANAYLLMDDLGHAIVNYRRAQKLMPADPLIASNLAEARRRVETRIEPDPGEEAVAAIFFWRHLVSPRIRFAAFAALFAAAWLWAVARRIGSVERMRSRRLPRWPALICGVASLLIFATLAIDECHAATHVEGVIIESIVGRKGPSKTGYEPSFSEPLAPGVEFTVLERRPAWLLIELRDGRHTWTPANSIELIEEPAGAVSKRTAA